MSKKAKIEEDKKSKNQRHIFEFILRRDRPDLVPFLDSFEYKMNLLYQQREKRSQKISIELTLTDIDTLDTLAEALVKQRTLDECDEIQHLRILLEMMKYTVTILMIMNGINYS